MGLFRKDSFQTFGNYSLTRRLALIIQAILSDYADMLFHYVPRIAKKFNTEYPFDGPIVSFKMRSPLLRTLDYIIYFDCANNLTKADRTVFKWASERWDFIARELDIFRVVSWQYDRVKAIERRKRDEGSNESH